MINKNFDFVYDKTLKALKEYVKDNPNIFKDIKEVDFDTVTNLAYEFEQVSLINFSIVSRTGTDDSEWWTECDYSSEKLNKTIIWDYDYNDNYNCVRDFLEQLATTEAEINQFERELIIRKK
jgi:hypothetical protein